MRHALLTMPCCLQRHSTVRCSRPSSHISASRRHIFVAALTAKAVTRGARCSGNVEKGMVSTAAPHRVNVAALENAMPPHHRGAAGVEKAIRPRRRSAATVESSSPPLPQSPEAVRSGWYGKPRRREEVFQALAEACVSGAAANFCNCIGLRLVQ